MIRRAFFGTCWFIMFALGTLVVGGGIAGGTAGANDADAVASIREGYEIGAEAGAAFRTRYRWPIFAVSAILAAAGTAAGFLPGTKR